MDPAPKRAVVPRDFKLMIEADNGEKGLGAGACSYGLEDEHALKRPAPQRELDFYRWRGTIWGPPHGAHENRIYDLKMICDENYPSAPPKFFFISKINLPGVNQQTGELEPNFVPYLRDWSELYQKWLQTAPNTPDTMTLEAALLAIRKYMDQHKKMEQPPEGAKYDMYK